MSIPNFKKIQPYAYFLYNLHMADHKIYLNYLSSAIA